MIRSGVHVALLCCCLPALLSAESLTELLSRMDAAAASYRGVSARVEKLSYTAIIDDNSLEVGTMWMMRSGARDARVRIEFTEPDPRSVAFHGRKAEIYYPKINTVHEYDLGSQRALVEQFLLLGFGTPGKSLAKDYELRLAGEERVAEVQTTRLELMPRSRKTREHLAKVELWIANPGGYPVRQKFYWPSRDHTTITYTEVQWNLDLPKGVTREFPQK